MRILINHLTRMQAGHICVAGIDLQSGLHIRPVGNRQLGRQLLVERGGPVGLANVVDIGDSHFCGRYPEIEDRMCEPENWKLIDTLSSQAFLERLVPSASESLQSIFGPDLKPYSERTLVVEERQGLRSLGLYWAHKPKILTDTQSGKLRFRCNHTPFDLQLPITELRLYKEDHVTAISEAVELFNTLMQKSDKVLISIGLSRPFRKSNDQPALHWLQVNNIHVCEVAP